MSIVAADLFRHEGYWSFRASQGPISLSGGFSELLDAALGEVSLQGGLFLVASSSRLVYAGSLPIGLPLFWTEARLIRRLEHDACYRDDVMGDSFRIPRELFTLMGGVPHPEELHLGVYSALPVRCDAPVALSRSKEDLDDVSLFARSL